MINHLAVSKDSQTVLYHPDTIAAIATAPGRGGVGVIRVSGQDLGAIVAGLIGRELAPRHAHFAKFKAADAEVIDEGLALYFPNPQSFTGENVLELQGHGGPVVLRMLLARCVELGARHAEPGEFTKRAFLNGKLDLAQAEAVADLIDAQSEAAARSALKSLDGAFSREINTLVEQLINLRMLVEATIDFPEEDIDFLEAANARGKLNDLQAQLARVLATASQGRLLREGMHVVLIGQPNVGKSSLMNALAGEEVAIVTEIAGTTRDTVRELIQLDGVPLHIIDTAGLRETTDTVEQIGIERTWRALDKADLALLLLDSREGITAHDEAILQRLPATLPVLRVFNKIDLTGESAGVVGENEVHVSAQSGSGLDALRGRLLQMAGWHGASEGVFIARERHLDAIRRGAEHLENAGKAFYALELFAEELRLAQLALNEITGEFSSDDLLGVIFSRFCIGK
ncbi:tRNA uridine-5-carboxymethylaminomethyl(34) synthesis GTPase MnmE [Silvimonas sp.]|uniref:tRNA uridine-5-carboxymethylaminomethyl(34) synthesis GTPase MnmE n=1 Tax=Silvimonas sp. TaxID=2650811 RepID=UPI00284AEFB9|nr:tRNA uridine-5-carboxymethylaminomethyl(34) synthesis GTPase MnmE [Silvimonas sp.]MDR3429731.1 tRNA uridine-5-carboxymethylaminomethyl(34) synthesis GTPase MnmE [Silvimonas sp.]